MYIYIYGISCLPRPRTFFITIHFVLEIPFYNADAWRWVVYGLLALLQMLFSAVVKRRILAHCFFMNSPACSSLALPFRARKDSPDGHGLLECLCVGVENCL